jgi:DNA adenine methylase
MRPLFSYYGGKQRLIGKILPLIPPHNFYVEPFAGGATVFWAKALAPVNVINDKNEDIVNFYRVVKTKYDELRAMLSWTLHSRALYNRAKDIFAEKEKHTDVERAWAWWVLVNCSFNNKLKGGWAMQKKVGQPRNFPRSVQNKIKLFGDKEVWLKLKETYLECDDALRVIKRWDCPEAFFYVDPPYVGTHQGHYVGYEKNDLLELLDVLSKIKGRFVLSHFDNADIMRYAAKNGWEVFKTERRLTANVLNRSRKNLPLTQKTEMIVMNYEPPPAAARLLGVEKTLFSP